MFLIEDRTQIHKTAELRDVRQKSMLKYGALVCDGVALREDFAEESLPSLQFVPCLFPNGST